MKLIHWLRGKKTYILVILGAVLNVAVQAEWMTVENLEAVNTVLVFLGIGAVRLGIAGK